MFDTEDKLVEELLQCAREHGLTEDIEPGFLMWVGNEVWENREVASLMVLRERAPELVSFYKADRAREEAAKGPHLKVVCADCGQKMEPKPCAPEQDGKTSHGVCPPCFRVAMEKLDRSHETPER